jgi:chemotaxis protein MotB
VASLASGRRARPRTDYWPGFVDALSTLLLVFTFLTSVFMLAQFFLAQEITGRDTALTRLNRQILELTELLSLERGGRQGLEEQINALTASLAEAERERVRLRGELDGARGAGGDAAGRIGELARRAEEQQRISDRALAQVELLNQQLAALRRQLAAVEQALVTSEAREGQSQARIADLGQRLNVALAQRVQELSRYRSDFFGRLREILSNRDDIRIVGDRFVFSSEVFFPPASAEMTAVGQAEVDKLAAALVDLQRQIPPEIPWVLRVDGHTDRRPIRNLQFPSNWELSASRAISVVRLLIARGIPAERLVAAGFGEFQPIDPGEGEQAFARNRRIELRLTDR